MKRDNNLKNSFLSRARLISRKRSNSARDNLPESHDGMFDFLHDFSSGTRKHIDTRKSKP